MQSIKNNHLLIHYTLFPWWMQHVMKASGDVALVGAYEVYYYVNMILFSWCI